MWRGRFVFNEIRNWKGFSSTYAPLGLEVLLCSVIKMPPHNCSTIGAPQKNGGHSRAPGTTFCELCGFFRSLVIEVIIAALQAAAMSWRTSIPLRRSQFRRTEPIVENYMRLNKALATGMNVFACIKIV